MKIEIKNQDVNIVNKHGEHLAMCLCCEKLRGSLGDWGRDEDPALDNPYIECDDGEFSFSENDSWYKAVEIIHNTAHHCKLFVPVKEEVI